VGIGGFFNDEGGGRLAWSWSLVKV